MLTVETILGWNIWNLSLPRLPFLPSKLSSSSRFSDIISFFRLTHSWIDWPGKQNDWTELQSKTNRKQTKENLIFNGRIWTEMNKTTNELIPSKLVIFLLPDIILKTCLETVMFSLQWVNGSLKKTTHLLGDIIKLNGHLARRMVDVDHTTTRSPHPLSLFLPTLKVSRVQDQPAWQASNYSIY